jgi:RNA polymerase sigma-70 factor (ECF subfamily)
MAEQILQRVAEGDGEAVKACIDTYGSLVWSLARRGMPDRDDAEDLVQEIFTEIWKTAGRFDPDRGTEATFVAMIARRRIIDRTRRRARTPDTASLADEHHDVLDAAAEIRVESGAESALAAKLLDRLSDDQKTVLTLAVAHGLSHRQVAAKTGLPLGSVKTHARRGLLRMREMLAAEGVALGRRSST